MKDYYVYILLCNNKKYYTGVTNNLERRLKEHQLGIHKESYTFSRRPVKLVYYELFHSINDAIEREKQIQDWSQQKKEALITENWDRLKLLSMSRQARHDSIHSPLNESIN